MRCLAGRACYGSYAVAPCAAECAQELRKQTQRCPICRNPVESLLHIRLGNKSAAGAVPLGKDAAPAKAAGPALSAEPAGTAVA